MNGFSQKKLQDNQLLVHSYSRSGTVKLTDLAAVHWSKTAEMRDNCSQGLFSGFNWGL
jgi:hypothetical protein